MQDRPTRRRLLVAAAVGSAVLIAVAVVVAVGFWRSSSSDTSYSRSATISVDSINSDPASSSGSGFSSFSFNAIDIASLEDTGPVAERLVQLQGGSVQDYLTRLTISATDTDLGVVLTAKDEDEKSAVALANDAANAWVEIFNSTPTASSGTTFRAQVIDPAR